MGTSERRSGAGRATFEFLHDLHDEDLETLAHGTISYYTRDGDGLSLDPDERRAEEFDGGAGSFG